MYRKILTIALCLVPVWQYVIAGEMETDSNGETVYIYSEIINGYGNHERFEDQNGYQNFDCPYKTKYKRISRTCDEGQWNVVGHKRCKTKFKCEKVEAVATQALEAAKKPAAKEKSPSVPQKKAEAPLVSGLCANAVFEGDLLVCHKGTPMETKWMKVSDDGGEKRTTVLKYPFSPAIDRDLAASENGYVIEQSIISK